MFQQTRIEQRLKSIFEPMKRARKERTVKQCGNCDMPHRLETKWCGVCLELSRIAHKKFYYSHKKQGLCVECTENAPNSVRCTHHRDYHNEWSVENRRKQIEAGLCAYSSCQEEPGEMLMCKKHQDLTNEMHRNYRRPKARRAA